jgi:perosamine synthetase
MSDLPRLPVAQPSLDGNEKAYVNECLDTTWISSAGRFIGEFEAAFAAFCGTKHAVAANNGTTALHLALIGLDLQPGDEVIVPSLTYIASANAVKYCGAEPVFVDNDAKSFNLDPAAVEAAIGPKTRGIMVVHLYGHPVDMDPINTLAEKHGLWVIEDAAEAVGATYKGRKVGALARCATFSFFGNKIITTGEGGMITTDDDALAARMRLYRGQGMDLNRRYWFPVIGYNYRMTNIAAAIGLAQLERIDHHLESRQRVAAWYEQHLAPLGDKIVRPTAANWAGHVWWMYSILVGEGAGVSRDQVMADLAAENIETRPLFFPLHVLPPYRDARRGPVAVAEDCAARGVNLPTFGAMTEADVIRVARALEKSLA